jgi:hypothetical protein
MTQARPSTCHPASKDLIQAEQSSIFDKENQLRFRYNRGEASDGSLPVNVDVSRKSNAVVWLLSRSAVCMAPAPFDSEMSCPAPVLTGLAQLGESVQSRL